MCWLGIWSENYSLPYYHTICFISSLSFILGKLDKLVSPLQKWNKNEVAYMYNALSFMCIHMWRTCWKTSNYKYWIY
jgi:hypothetical protein